MCWNHCETLALFTSWHSVSVLMLKSVYISGFNKYVNQVHISLGMQMSLMRKNKLQNKQTKAEKMLNSSCESGDRKEVDWRYWAVILAILGLFNQLILKLWQINCFLAGSGLGKDGSQTEFSHKKAWKSLVLLFVAIQRAERIEFHGLNSLTRAQYHSKGPQLSETLVCAAIIKIAVWFQCRGTEWE